MIVVILVIIGLFMIFGRGEAPAGTDFEGGTGAEINLPSEVDLSVNEELAQ